MNFFQACQRMGMTPREVLSTKLRPHFKDAYALYFMEVIHKSFWDKAEGNADIFGQTWQALRDVTVLMKQQMLNEIPGDEGQAQKFKADGSKNGIITYTVQAGPQLTGVYTHRKFLSPRQLQTYRSNAVGKHRSTRNNRGLASVQHTAAPENAELINVRSGRLAAALAPVTASRGRLYQSNPDSSYFWEANREPPILVINISVPYAEAVHYGEESTPPRPLLPPKLAIETYVNEEAVKQGLIAAKRIHDMLKVRM